MDDVEREAERLNALGFKIARAVERRTKFTVGFVGDPNGIWLELYLPRKTYPDKDATISDDDGFPAEA